MRTMIPPPVILLLFGLAAWAIDRTLPELSLSFAGQRWLGIGFMVAGVGLDLVAAGAFRGARTTVNPLRPDKASALVTGGLYRITRNPMYLGLLLILTGWVIDRGTLLAPVLIAAFIGTLTVVQIKAEEAVLERKFGDDYRAYKQRVRRWI